jgi:hypothetical protein
MIMAIAKSKFDSEYEHHHPHIDIFQTLLTQSHKLEQTLNRLLGHEDQETIDDPMLNS